MEVKTETKLRTYGDYLDKQIGTFREDIDQRIRDDSISIGSRVWRIAQDKIEVLEGVRNKLYEFFPELKTKSSP